MTEENKVDYENLGAIRAEIDFLEDNVPDKRTKEYETWKERFNYLTNLYNQTSDGSYYKQL